MPFTIDEERMKAKTPFMRDGQEIKPLFEMKVNEPPVIPIPIYNFPRVVYMHPNEPFRTVEHRNDKFEVVGTETEPTDHLSKLVACADHMSLGDAAPCEKCEAALKAALDEGWVKEPYLPKAPPNRDANLYGKRKAKPEGEEVARSEPSNEKHGGSARR